MTAQEPPGAAEQNGALRGIQDVAKQWGISHRTLRFYEDRGLIAPMRVGNTRIYGKREVARIQLILRGKSLGFSIREIKEFLDLYDADPSHAEQLRRLLKEVRARIAQLTRQREEIRQTLSELRQIESETLDKLSVKVPR